MKTCVVSLRLAQMGHKMFLCITEEGTFHAGDHHNVFSLARKMFNGGGFGKLQLRSWINNHSGLGVEWDKMAKRLNFGEEVE